MAKYDSRHLPKLLKDGDVVSILGHTLEVKENYLRNPDPGPNRLVINAMLGLDRDDHDDDRINKLFFAVTTLTNVGDWPQPTGNGEQTQRAQATFVRFLFKLSKTKSLPARWRVVNKLIGIGDRKKRKRKVMAKLPRAARLMVKYFDANTEAFGCQRRHVLALLGFLTKSDLSTAVANINAD